jgi:hypothetical protein
MSMNEKSEVSAEVPARSFPASDRRDEEKKAWAEFFAGVDERRKAVEEGRDVSRWYALEITREPRLTIRAIPADDERD